MFKRAIKEENLMFSVSSGLVCFLVVKRVSYFLFYKTENCFRKQLPNRALGFGAHLDLNP